MKKNLIRGLVAMIAFYLFNAFIMYYIGGVVFENSVIVSDYRAYDAPIYFHIFTYTGLMTLCATIVVCTYIIVEKLNEVKKEVNNSK